MATRKITSADLNKLHYKSQRRSDPRALMSKRLAGSDFELKSVNRGIAQFKHSDGSTHVSVKGTDPRNIKDLISDVKLGLGVGGTDKQFKRRRNQLKDIARETEGPLYLTGHSLGSSIVTKAMATSKGLRDRVTKADLYNTGYTSAFHKEVSQGLTPSDKAQLKKKITHHHVKMDPLSTALTFGAVGKVKTYEVERLDKHTIDNF